MTRDEALQRIRELQALADRTTYSEEADTARLKIDHLSTKFDIASHEVAEPVAAPQPAWPFPPGATVVHFTAPFVHFGNAANQTLGIDLTSSAVTITFIQFL